MFLLAAAEPVTNGSSDPIVIIGLAVISTVGTFITALFAYLSSKNSREAKATAEGAARATEEVRAVADDTRRVLTTNHGDDHAGRKLDKIEDIEVIVREIRKEQRQTRTTMSRVVDSVVGLKADVENLKNSVPEVANQVADQTIVHSVSFAEINHRLDELAD